MSGTPRGRRLSATGVRQGRWGRHMAWVLVASLLLATLALAAVWAWRAGDFAAAERSHATTMGDAAGFHAPAPSSG
ncbi:MAG TPA: hypothetical protein VII63_03200 [Caulobacteraceae bacterium]